jgi:P27 family predicted phage terminase small subunit
MARPRKVIQLQTGDLTKKKRDQLEYDQKLIQTGKDELDSPPDGTLIDATARKEYFRVLENLRQLDFIGNLDRSSLISYSNAYATYVRAIKETRKKDFQMIIITGSGSERPNPIYKIIDQAKKQMEAAGKMIGISVSSRLTIAGTKQKQQQEELARAFGDI